ncbi:MFS transporter [Trebonia kvetii]|uniref:MFS transporter n=1 Tax=Trebonia kvetii TaxID=2480626 RepID=A0A6P2BZM8_9ACTN|nr:MFS transporter [Trebonia kvetii]TVZ04554.1 MFS transporter [Trebonia kvetii]
MVVLDATVVNIALPTAQRDLAFSNANRQWVVTAYSLAFGGLLLVGGRMSDLVGRKRMLIIGRAVHSYAVTFWVSAGIFAGAAVVCGLVLRPGVLEQPDSETAVFAAA